MVLSGNQLEIPIPLIFEIYPYKQFDGLTNMAIDHFFASEFEDQTKCIFRFYGWKPYCISLGFHQSAKLINNILLKKEGFDVVRRPTGGRAILHSEELTYCIIFPKHVWSQQSLYNYTHQIFLRVLRNLEFNVDLATLNPKLTKIENIASDYPCFTRSAETEVEYKSRKLIGSAQKIYEKSILQHGSILIGKYHENLSKYLNTDINERKLIQEEIQSKTACLKDTGIEVNEDEIILETFDQLEKESNISLSFLEFDEKLVKEAIQLYKYKFKNE